MNNLYKGTFNVVGLSYAMHTRSKNQEMAKLNFIHQLAKKVSLPKFYLYSMFDGSKDNYRIEEVKR